MRRLGWLAAWAAVLLAPSLLHAQTPDRVEEVECDGWSDGDRYCEIREYTLEARASLAVEGGANGGIEVAGWDRNEIRLVAKVQAGSRDGDARDLAREVELRVGDVIEAEGPRSDRRGEHWGVSFELRVPRATRLRLRANNGGIDLAELTGDVDARTTNGGIHLNGGAGHVRGETTNGGLHVELTGRTWQGEGVELRTTNGGVDIRVPAGYAADLETGTVNGGMEIDIPVTVQGRIDRTIRTELGGGGPLIKATTTNGGVRIQGG